MATKERWEMVEQWASEGDGGTTWPCLLDLRAKVEALEAKLASPPCILVPLISDEQLESLKQPGRIEVLEPGDQMVAPAPAGGLVERVAKAPEARAAIREVADWLQQRTDTIANGSQWADLLRKEANQ
jgi:hypothetical protein